MKRLGIIFPALVFMLVLGTVIVPHVVRAEDGQDETETEQSSGSNESQTEAAKKAAEAQREAAKKAAEKAKEAAQKLAEQRKEAAQKRAEAAKEKVESQTETEKEDDSARQEAFQKSCEDRVENYKQRMETVITAVQKRAESIDTLVQRIQQFVSEKNLTVGNYTTLLTAIDTQKTLAKTIAVSAKENASGFDCSSSTSAKESLTSFSDVVKQEVDAIKAYKSAVLDLISAVKAAAGVTTTEGTNNAQ